MKYTWEEKDITCGILIKGKSGAEIFMLGYSYLDESRPKQYHLISLSDGLVVNNYSTQIAMAEHLNQFGYTPIVEHKKWSIK